MKKNVIIIGSRGYKYPYGGWETFVLNLVRNTHEKDTKFYIPSLTSDASLDKKVQIIDGVVCPFIYVKKQNFTTMFTFTIRSMHYFLHYIEKERLSQTVILMLGCKVGPFFPLWKKKLKQLHTKLIINPDGLEWKRDKWAWWIKKCFKISERFSIKYADYCVCDSKSIEQYVLKEYYKYPLKTKFIAFGAYENRKPSKTDLVKTLWNKYHIRDNEYFLIVGRFIPENNYEVMIREFMKAKTSKDLVIICNVEENDFYHDLILKTKFVDDQRIKFVGSVYDEETLLYIRGHAYAYIHGHSVGGTNPSLLEALSITKMNLLFDVCYNREVGEDACLYFSKENDSLKHAIEEVLTFDKKKIEEYGVLAKKRIHEDYTWDLVVKRYQEVFEYLIKQKED